MENLNATITNLINLAMGIALLGCAFFLCLAGYKFMTANGSPSGIESAKSAAFNALIGLGVVLSARVLANILQGAIVTG